MRGQARGGEILIVNPEGLEERGGMGHMVRYLAAAMAADGSAAPRVLDSRGTGSAWFAPFYVLRTLCQITIAGLGAGVRLVHVNMAENTSVLRKGVIVLFCKAMGIPTLLHLHAGLFIPFYERLSAPGRFWVRLVFRAASLTVVLGSLWKRYLVETLGADPARVVVVYNGVAPCPPPALRAAGPCRLLYVGKLRPEKGLTELIEALAHPDLAALAWHLTLVGDGERGHFEALAQRLGLASRLTFTGWLEREAVNGALRDADVYVLPSHHEGLPLAVLEALSARLAVVTTAVGALPEVLTHGRTALLVPPKDTAALRAALGAVITDPDLRARLAVEGATLYHKRFTDQAFTQAIRRLYDRLAPGGS